MPVSAPPHVEARHRARIEAFIVRARRVEAHSLAQDRDALHNLSVGALQLDVTGDEGDAIVTQELPPEEVMESAAARVRPILLSQEECYLPGVLKAVRHLTAGHDGHEAIETWCAAVLAQWKSRTNEHDPGRDVGMQLMVHDTTTGVGATLNDLELAMAWIYGDVVHHDPQRRSTSALFGLRERFRAGTMLVAYAMVETLVVLDGIRQLITNGTIDVDPTVLTEDVTLTTTTLQLRARAYIAPADAPMPADAAAALGAEWIAAGQAIDDLDRQDDTRD